MIKIPDYDYKYYKYSIKEEIRFQERNYNFVDGQLLPIIDQRTKKKENNQKAK